MPCMNSWYISNPDILEASLCPKAMERMRELELAGSVKHANGNTQLARKCKKRECWYNLQIRYSDFCICSALFRRHTGTLCMEARACQAGSAEKN